MTDQPYRVLLVEDNPDDAMLMLRALAKVDSLAIKADYVGSLHDALAHVAGQHTDVVLLDLALPDGSGLDILGKLKASKSQPAVVVITGQGSEAMAVNAMRGGADNYITKPVKPAELDLVLSDALAWRE